MIGFLGLGTNLGNRIYNLENVLLRLEAIGLKIKKKSPIYKTKPMYNIDQKNFYNQVIKVNCILRPKQLLYCTKKIEVEK